MKIRIEFDLDKSVDQLVAEFVLAASAVFHERGSTAWAEAMTELSVALRKHVEDNDQAGTS